MFLTLPCAFEGLPLTRVRKPLKIFVTVEIIREFLLLNAELIYILKY